uniref:Uncharacterized protein n=1 Tax=Arundo donax TaxID=35708 RepID=A0A0A9HKA4_ARUDO
MLVILLVIFNGVNILMDPLRKNMLISVFAFWHCLLSSD